MKKFKFYTLTILISFLIFGSLKLNSQEISSFQLSDVNSYFNAYFEPFARATAVSMGGGWYNTANTHKLFGVDVTLIAISGAMIPDEDKLFPASELTLGNDLSLSTQADIPTLAASSDDKGPMLQKTVTYTPAVGGELTVTQDLFNLNSGAGVGIGMAPNMFQIGFGLPKGTDLKIRFIPKFSIKPINLDEVSLWGFGVQHDIKQWIPVVSKVPVLQISALFAYSKFSAGYSGTPFPMDPALFQATSSLPDNTWDDQSLGIEASSFVGNLIIGAKLPVFHPYVSVGFNSAKFKGGLRGSFPIVSMQEQGINVVNVVEEVDKDPIDIDISETMMNVAAGFRLKLTVITLFGQYTLQKYPMFTAGLGISIR